ncbi:hypothetical protein LWI28_029038 [Acer negundo]|uniref:PGG domain-containing protein n=1 Tax=Acer negundo TaxID=4023 RepID=A0AAD5NK35_ACENE|nr:hypothetical protein LWI28_029038 [Acer negundo]
MSQQAENEGVQPNHNNSVTNSSLEEPINQLPYNLLGRGGRGDISQSFEAFQIAYTNSYHSLTKKESIVDCKGTAEHLNYYRPLFNAAQRGDWNTAKSFINNDPYALTAQISIHLGTVLHIAAECCQWKFILMLLELDVSTPQSIAVQNVIGNTVLHYVAEGGSLKTAKALVEKNPDLLQMVDDLENLPLLNSIYSKSKELVWYLSLKTRVESPSYPFFIPELTQILRTLILSDYPGRQGNVLQVAIECRQETIVNIIKKISPITVPSLCAYKLENNSTLHLAGKLAPASKLFSVSGAALQMQRELQWFKEVEMYTHPAYRVWRNSEKQTAKDAFSIAHENLSKDGEKWMKDTANSSMLVSTLIATVLFAAIFTVPGGNFNETGIPIFLRSKAFTVFAISNALSLFSSLTSLLMFLAILTARYDIEDFIESLPKKLIIGLGSLFFAIAAMIIAFGAAQTIILRERWHWVSVPITLLASFPVAMFVMLQLPLFVQMVQSTYGASMFHPWPSRKFE